MRSFAYNGGVSLSVGRRDLDGEFHYHGPVNANYAGLLAQVVPVIAIALGIEMRSLAARIRETGNPAQASTWQRSTLLTLSITLLMLACIEVKALSVVAGPNFHSTWATVVIGGIAVAFLAPTLDTLSQVGLPSKRQMCELLKSGTLESVLIICGLTLAILVVLGSVTLTLSTLFT